MLKRAVAGLCLCAMMVPVLAFGTDQLTAPQLIALTKSPDKLAAALVATLGEEPIKKGTTSSDTALISSGPSSPSRARYCSSTNSRARRRSKFRRVRSGTRPANSLRAPRTNLNTGSMVSRSAVRKTSRPTVPNPMLNPEFRPASCPRNCFTPVRSTTG